MLKVGSINDVAKKGVIGALFATSLLGVSFPMKANAKVNKGINNTEVVSKNGADAMKSLVSYSINNVKTQQVVKMEQLPCEERLKSDLRVFAETNEEAQEVEDLIKDAYTAKNSYYSSAYLQAIVDLQAMNALITGRSDLIEKLAKQNGKQLNIDYKKFAEVIKPYQQEISDKIVQIVSQNVASISRAKDTDDSNIAPLVDAIYGCITKDENMSEDLKKNYRGFNTKYVHIIKQMESIVPDEKVKLVAAYGVHSAIWQKMIDEILMKNLDKISEDDAVFFIDTIDKLQNVLVPYSDSDSLK